mmetsp:Transcript_20419/g.64474  ORF Transcript_20419/g.64474 Transcript_20419/m.64474 type:complete len:426 (-) Transcript_20419:440-1717(-)
MRARLAAVLALAALGLFISTPLARGDDGEGEDEADDMDDYDDDYGGGGYGGDEYGDYGDEYGGGGGGPPPMELKELIALEDFDEFLNDEDASVVGFFEKEGDDLEAFKSTAESLQYDFRFAWTTSEEILAKYKYKSAAVVFKSPRFTSDKYDKPKARFPGASFSNSDALKIFVREKSLPLVGQFTYKTKSRYTDRGMPIVKVFFDVDYELNPKGSNYYVNRVRKVAADYIGKLSFTIAAISDYSYETSDYGLELEANKKQVGVGIEDGDKRYGMVGKDFSVNTLKEFVESFIKGELKPTKVIEPYVPPPPAEEEDVDDSAVTVLDADNFKSHVDGTKDAMVEFYAPWCGHCKALAPEYGKLGKKFEEEEDVLIAKFDADAHTVPSGYDVQGFPTIFYVPKGGTPEPYNGDRTADAMADFIRGKRS